MNHDRNTEVLTYFRWRGIFVMTENKSVVVYGCFHPNYAEEIEYFDQCKVYSIQIESTLQCQQGCLYCYASDENTPMKELPKEPIMIYLNAPSIASSSRKNETSP